VPTIETLEKISDALEIPLYRLLYDGDESAQGVTVAAGTATNGNKRGSRKNEVRLLRELRGLLSRIRKEDQHLLLFIARKMATRVPRGSGTEVSVVGGSDRTMSSETEVGNS